MFCGDVVHTVTTFLCFMQKKDFCKRKFPTFAASFLNYKRVYYEKIIFNMDVLSCNDGGKHEPEGSTNYNYFELRLDLD